MNIGSDLLHILEDAHSLAPILQAATRVIAHRLDADRCSVFLVDQEGELARYDSHVDGATRCGDDDMARIAAEVVATRHGAARQGPTASLLGSPMLLRDQMIGALGLLRSGPAAFAATDVET